jgi:hypothetical protein
MDILIEKFFSAMAPAVYILSGAPSQS